MVRRFDSSRVFYRFDPNLQPIGRVEPGEEVVLETRDCFSNQISDESQKLASIDFSQVNPATGPIFVEGAEAGDALAVKIKRIKTSEQGLVVAIPGEGFLGEYVRESRIRKCVKKGDFVELGGVKVPYRPMIGVIGVASREAQPTGVPGRNGGNLDTKYITEGATLYLPVEFSGALFGLGDLHSAMADGEISVSGCEVKGEVTVEFEVLKNLSPPWPVLEYRDTLYLIVSAGSLEESLKEAARSIVKAFSAAFGLDWHDAYLLSSLAADIQISQLVDPKKTVRVAIPSSLMDARTFLSALKR